MRHALALLLLIGAAGAVDLTPGGNPALPDISFPLVNPSTGMAYPLGMCADGSAQLYADYQAAGLSPVLLSSPTHMWVAVPDGDKWLAVDSYFGPTADGSYYSGEVVR